VAGRIMSMKNSNETIGNQTTGLPDCGAVIIIIIIIIIIYFRD
jgi:hypothetical protein